MHCTTGFRATNVRDVNTFRILIDYGSFYEGKLKGVIPYLGKLSSNSKPTVLFYNFVSPSNTLLLFLLYYCFHHTINIPTPSFPP